MHIYIHTYEYTYVHVYVMCITSVTSHIWMNDAYELWCIWGQWDGVTRHSLQHTLQHTATRCNTLQHVTLHSYVSPERWMRWMSHIWKSHMNEWWMRHVWIKITRMNQHHTCESTSHTRVNITRMNQHHTHELWRRHIRTKLMSHEGWMRHMNQNETYESTSHIRINITHTNQHHTYESTSHTWIVKETHTNQAHVTCIKSVPSHTWSTSHIRIKFEASASWFVCRSLFICVHSYVWIHMCEFICVNTYVWIHMCEFICVNLYVWIHMCQSSLRPLLLGHSSVGTLAGNTKNIFCVTKWFLRHMIFASHVSEQLLHTYEWVMSFELCHIWGQLDGLCCSVMHTQNKCVAVWCIPRICVLQCVAYPVYVSFTQLICIVTV